MAKMQPLNEIEGLETAADAWLAAHDAAAKAEATRTDAERQIIDGVEPVLFAFEAVQTPQTAFLVRSTSGRKVEIGFPNKPKQIPEGDLETLVAKLGALAPDIVREETTVTLSGDLARWALAGPLHEYVGRPDVAVRTAHKLIDSFRETRGCLRGTASAETIQVLEVLERTAMTKPSLKPR